MVGILASSFGFPIEDNDEPDWVGRTGSGRRETGPRTDPYGRLRPDAGFERLRKAWRAGAPPPMLFGSAPFELAGRVARRGENRRSDVAKLQVLLARTGHMDLAPLDGPTGYFSQASERAIRDYQEDNGLKVDGVVDPGGETVRSLERRNSKSDGDTGHGPGQAEKVISLRPVGRSLLPADALTVENRRKFQRRTEYAFLPTERGMSLVSQKTGRTIGRFSEDRAAELAAQVDDYADRIGLLELFDRQDITAEEKLRMADRMLPSVDKDEFDARHLRTPHARALRQRRFQARNNLTEGAWSAFRQAVQDREFGLSPQLAVEPLQQALFPELYGTERDLSEFFKDFLPGLGNIRALDYAGDEIDLAMDALKEGEWDDVAEHAGKGLLEGVGAIPGANAAKAIIKRLPYGKAALASGKLSAAERRFDDLSNKVDAEKFFGETFSNLSPYLRQRIGLATGNAYGAAGEKFIADLAMTVDSLAHKPGMVKIPPSNWARSGRRFFDYYHRRLSDVIRDDIAASYARFSGKAPTGPRPGVHVEVKTGAAIKNPRQEKVDNWLLENPEEAAKRGVTGIRDYRVMPHEISIDFVMDDMRARFDKMIQKKALKPTDANAMLDALRRQKAGGVKNVSALDYVGVISRLSVSGHRNFNREEVGEVHP